MALQTKVDRGPGPPSGPCPPLFEIVLVSCRGKVPFTIALGEEQEDGEVGATTTEDFVGTEGDTESFPDAPSRVGSYHTTRNDTGFEACADMAKVRAEFVTVPSRTRRAAAR
jgi:hypothetical protein